MVDQLSRLAIWAAATLLLVSLLVTGWRARRDATTPPGAVAEPSPVFDFGELLPGESRKHVFNVRGVSNDPLVVDRIIAECGCTTVPSDIVGCSIDANSCVEIPVSFVAPRQQDKFRKRVFVFFYDKQRAPLVLTITATVRFRVLCEPERVAFDSIAASTKAERFVKISRRPGTARTKITAATTNSPFLSATIRAAEGSDGSPATGAWVVCVSTLPPLPNGRTDAAIFIRCAEPDLGNLVIPVTLLVEGANAGAR